MPDTFGFFLPVVQTKQGVSNDNVTIEILDIPSSPSASSRAARPRTIPLSMRQARNERVMSVARVICQLKFSPSSRL
jgi:uncharacterized protein (DUF2252 family)